MCGRPLSEKWWRFRNTQLSHAKCSSVAHSPDRLYYTCDVTIILLDKRF